MRQFVTAECRHDPHGKPRRQPTHDRPAHDQTRKPGKRVKQARIRHAEHYEPHEQPKQSDRRCIVEQTLAFDDPRQPARRRDRAEDRNHRRGISCRHDSADQQAGCQRKGACPEKRVSYAQGGHDHGHHRQHDDRDPVVQHPSQIHPQSCLKQQRWQENIKKDIGPDRKPKDRLGHRVQRIRQIGLEKKGRAEGYQDPKNSQDNAVRQTQFCRERLSHPDNEKKRCDDRSDKNNIHETEIAGISDK